VTKKSPQGFSNNTHSIPKGSQTMEKLDLSRWQHDHDFTVAQEHGERRSLQVLALTAMTMVVDIICGSIFGSMALLADGWHMGTHVAAFAITIFAYRYTRKHARCDRFSFGTGKVSALVITKWAHGLIQETSGILLDESITRDTRQGINSVIRAENRIDCGGIAPLGARR
jgi:Co/Zn/Cd efflux system component